MRSADAVVQASVDFGLSGEVGLGAVLVGAVGLVVGLARHGRKRRAAAERVIADPTPSPARQAAQT
jgi:hypothetical protein